MGLFSKKLVTVDAGTSPTSAIGVSPPQEPYASVRENRRASAPTSEYGITQVVELMRGLPVAGNIELVIKVVKATLESARIQVSTIIEGANKKLEQIESRVHTLKAEIGGLEAEIATRKQEIDVLEAEHKETSAVQERLTLAEYGVKTAAHGSDKDDDVRLGGAPIMAVRK